LIDKKPRVYQVAKDFNLSSDALLEILKGLGVKARSHMSTLDHSAVDLVRERFNQEKEAVQADDQRKQEAKAAKEREAANAKRAAAEAKVAAAEPPAPAPPPPPTPISGTVAEPGPPPPPEPTPPPAPARRPGTRLAPSRPERRRRRVTDDKAVRESVKRTLASMEGTGKGKRYRKRSSDDTDVAVATEAANTVMVNELASVAELAEKLGVNPSQIITKLLGMGKMATQNQRLDKDTIELVALEFDYAVQFESEYGSDRFVDTEVDSPEDLAPRAPVVTVMGHVDHGKTSLLDYVRKSNVVAGEKGGITQHIGAYEVLLSDGREVTFLDTPGHEAFTAMRARGAQATDIVVLVVAADDRVMPQTVEAIDHAKAANVPLIVAINKIDKPEANIIRVKQDLANYGLMIEEYGGKVPCVEISAKKGTNVGDLLEVILLQADIMELKADPKRRAKGVVIESRVERGRGSVATILVQTGTLKVGSPFVCGKEFGKVRAMFDERGHRVKEAGPSSPVEVTGWSGTPAAGDAFHVAKTEAEAREIGMERQLVARERAHQRAQRVRLDTFHSQLEMGEVQELRLIIKADVAGSVEVLSEQLGNLRHEEVRCDVIHAAVGQINESDVLLAAASGAVIIGFNVKADPGATAAAEREEVDVKIYNIIYEAVADVKSALEGLLKPEEVEKIMATIEVRAVFHISKLGPVAGSYVKTGTVNRNQRARVIRGEEVLHTGGISSLKRFKDDVREVAAGFECGVGVEGFKDFEAGDIIETFIIEQVARRLTGN